MIRTLCRSAAIAALAAGCIGAAIAQAAPTTAAAKPTTKWYDTITVKGFVQLDAIFPEGSSRGGEVSNFRVRRARPTIVAQVDPLTRLQVQFDLSTGKPYTGTTGSNSGVSAASVADTFAERTFPGFCYVRVGQMILPFGREIHDDNAAVRSPLEMSHAADVIALAERDLGVMVGSQVAENQRLHWEFGFFNGQGWRTADANANKTFSGRVAMYVIPQVRLGVSGMIGSYKDTSGKSTGLTYDRHVLGAELAANVVKDLTISGEVYNARFVDKPEAPTKQTRFTGGYLMAERWIEHLKSYPFVRYQRTYGDLQYRSFDLGWRYQYAANQRLTLQYDIVRAAHQNSLGARWQINF